MSTIDIREEKVNRIIFNGHWSHNVEMVKSLVRAENGQVYVQDEGEGEVDINSKQEALALVKSLEKAIEMGWFED